MKWLFFLIALLLLTPVLGYTTWCDAGAFTACDDFWGGDADATVTISCPSPWLTDGSFTCDVGACDDGYVSKDLCTTSHGAGSSGGGYCWGAAGSVLNPSESCPTSGGYTNSQCSRGQSFTGSRFSKISSGCKVEACGCNPGWGLLPVDHCWQFSDTFTARDSDISVDGSMSCFNKNSWGNTLTTNTGAVVGNTWCAEGGSYMGIMGGEAYCFATNCNPVYGWQSSFDAGCDCSAAECLSGDICVSETKDHRCYPGYSCSGSAWNGGVYDTLVKYTELTPYGSDSGFNLCAYGPQCDGVDGFGWKRKLSTDVVKFINDTGEIKSVNCADLIGDDQTTFGNACLAPGSFYYNSSTSECYYKTDCVNCGTYADDAEGYCGRAVTIGGWAGQVTDCPVPGTVRGDRCYYSKEPPPVCNENGCKVSYDLMLGDFYTCNATEGAVLKTIDIPPPHYVLQSIPSLMTFGFQDIAVFEAKQSELLTSCSCGAQDVMGRLPFCGVVGVYGFDDADAYYYTERSTLYRSTLRTDPLIPYFATDPYDLFDLDNLDNINSISCNCPFPNKTLLRGLQWLSDDPIPLVSKTNYEIKSDICARMYGTLDCYWNYTSKYAEAGLTIYHGPRLNVWDSWCKRASEGKPCDLLSNAFFSFLFDVRTLVDVRINMFNPNKTVPVYISLFEKGEVKTSLEEPVIKSLTNVSVGNSLDFEVVLNSNFIDFNFSDATLSVFCTEGIGNGALKVTVNGQTLGILDCSRTNLWQSIEFERPIQDILRVGLNLFSIEALDSDVFVGVNFDWDNTSPLNNTFSCQNYFVTGGKVICQDSTDSTNIYDIHGSFGLFSGLTVADLAFVNGAVYVLSDGVVYLNDFPIPGTDNVEFIASAYNKLFNYSDGGIIAGGYLEPELIDGVQWMRGASDALFVGADGTDGTGVFFVSEALDSNELLTSYYLPGSELVINYPFTIIDWNSDGYSDLIGVSDNSTGRLELSFWKNIGYGALVKELLVSNVSPFTELVAGDLSMNEGMELLFRASDGDYLWPDGAFSSGTDIDNGSPLPYDLDGGSWSAVDNFVYSFNGTVLANYSFFTLSQGTDVVYRLKLVEGAEYASPDLLYPNFIVPQTSFRINDSVFGFENKPLGYTMICGQTINYSFTFNQEENNELVHYGMFDFRVLLDEFPVNCRGIDGTPVDLSDISFPEGQDGVDVNIECRLPQCSWGLPLGKRLQMCVTAGEFEYENCFALDSLQPLASDPRGLRVSDVGVRLADSADVFLDTIYLCGAADKYIEVQGKVEDLLGYYKGVTGLGIYDSSGLRKAVYPDIGDPDIVMNELPDGTTFDDFLITVTLTPPSGSEDYRVKAFTGTYYETPDVDSGSFRVVTGSDCTPGAVQCVDDQVYACAGIVGSGCTDYVTPGTLCSGSSGTCQHYTGCSAGSCTTDFDSYGTDCGTNDFCDGAGGCSWDCVSSSDCSPAGTPTGATCEVYTGTCSSGTCQTSAAAAGTVCGSDYCDGAQGGCNWDCYCPSGSYPCAATSTGCSFSGLQCNVANVCERI